MISVLTKSYTMTNVTYCSFLKFQVGMSPCRSGAMLAWECTSLPLPQYANVTFLSFFGHFGHDIRILLSALITLSCMSSNVLCASFLKNCGAMFPRYGRFWATWAQDGFDYLPSGLKCRTVVARSTSGWQCPWHNWVMWVIFGSSCGIARHHQSEAKP